MKSFLTSAITFVTMCLVPAVASGEVWTYSDCVEYARLHNIDLRLSKLNEETTACNLEAAKAQWQPSLDFSTTHGFTNTPWGTNAKNSYNSTYGVNASWTVWNGGAREKNIEREKIQSRIDRLTTDDMMRSIETDLLQVYINILYAKESISIYEEAVKLSKAQAERAKALLEAGRISRVDYSQLQAQYEQDRYSLVNSQGTYASRRMELKKLLELGIDTDIEPAPLSWSDAEVLAALPPLEESYQLAVGTDLRLQGLELEKEGAAIDVDIAKATGKPQIALNAGVGTGYLAPGISFGKELKQGLSESIGLSLSIPILDNKRTSTATAKAKVEQLKAQLDIDQRHTDLAQLVENWYIDTGSAQSRFTAAMQQMESASLSAELTNEQFNLGLVNTVELMTAHNNLVEARHSLLQAKCMAILGQKMIEFYRTAKITL